MRCLVRPGQASRSFADIRFVSHPHLICSTPSIFSAAWQISAKPPGSQLAPPQSDAHATRRQPQTHPQSAFFGRPMRFLILTKPYDRRNPSATQWVRNLIRTTGSMEGTSLLANRLNGIVFFGLARHTKMSLYFPQHLGILSRECEKCHRYCPTAESDLKISSTVQVDSS